MDAQVQHMLYEASDEIKRLRRANEILAAKEEVLNIIACATGMTRDMKCGGSVDVAWKIDNYLRENA
jgi:hypothetical protein